MGSIPSGTLELSDCPMTEPNQTKAEPAVFPGASNETLHRLHERYLRSIDATIDRRFRYNWVMIVILGSILVGVGFLNKEFSGNPLGPFISIVGLALGLAQCTIWLVALSSFQALLSAKFAVLNSIEAGIGCKIHDAEYNLYNKSHYIALTKIEMGLPILGVVAFSTLLILFLMNKF